MRFNDAWYRGEDLDTIVRLIKAAPPGQLIELGCWEGRSTAALSEACAPRDLWAVDRWQSSEAAYVNTRAVVAERLFRENMEGRSNVRIVKMECLDFLRQTTGPIAFLHIDADHGYEIVRDTLTLAAPLLAPGAVLCGHDYVDAPGVQRAVRELLPGHGAAGQVWFWRAP